MSAEGAKFVDPPDGARIGLSAPFDYAKLWATLCSYRETVRRRVDDNVNALMVVRPCAGKEADGIARKMHAAAKALTPTCRTRGRR